jgi:hypothetical protein
MLQESSGKLKGHSEWRKDKPKQWRIRSLAEDRRWKIEDRNLQSSGFILKILSAPQSGWPSVSRVVLGGSNCSNRSTADAPFKPFTDKHVPVFQQSESGQSSKFKAN